MSPRAIGSGSDESPRLLLPPRFTLRTLWIAMTALSVAFGFMAFVGLLWSVALVFAAGLVLAHVLGNWLGTRLRDGADEDLAAEQTLVEPSSCPTGRLEIVAPRRLTERVRLHRLTLVLAGTGAAAGGALGGVEFAGMYANPPAAAVALGAISAAVLGGMLGFAATSFLWVARQALHEALGESDSQRRGKR